jgi:tetratricopeptide (TPR) repeat protein
MIHARAKGLVAHRDIKSSNCLLDEIDTLKVADFGLARIFDTPEKHLAERVTPARETSPTQDTTLPPSGAMVDSDGTRLSIILTRTGAMAGTLPYMAPEQLMGLEYTDVRSDIYSFGVMLFEWLTGRRPFDGATLNEYLAQHERSSVPLVADDPFTREYYGWDRLLARCLAKRPDQRFADFSAVRRALLTSVSQWRTGLREIDIDNTFGADRDYKHYETPNDYVVELLPLNTDELFQKATSLVRLGKLNESLADWAEYLGRVEVDSSVWLTVANTYCGVGNIGGALVAAKMAERLGDGTARPIIKDWQAHFERKALNSDSRTLLDNLVLSYLRNGRNALAIAYLGPSNLRSVRARTNDQWTNHSVRHDGCRVLVPKDAVETGRRNRRVWTDKVLGIRFQLTISEITRIAKNRDLVGVLGNLHRFFDEVTYGPRPFMWEYATVVSGSWALRRKYFDRVPVDGAIRSTQSGQFVATYRRHYSLRQVLEVGHERFEMNVVTDSVDVSQSAGFETRAHYFLDSLAVPGSETEAMSSRNEFIQLPVYKGDDSLQGMDARFADGFYQRARRRLLSDDWEVLKDAEAACILRPDDPVLLLMCGIAKLSVGDPDAASSDFSRAISLNPSFAEAYYNRAICQLKRRQINEAEQDFRRHDELTGRDHDDDRS